MSEAQNETGSWLSTPQSKKNPSLCQEQQPRWRRRPAEAVNAVARAPVAVARNGGGERPGGGGSGPRGGDRGGGTSPRWRRTRPRRATVGIVAGDRGGHRGRPDMMFDIDLEKLVNDSLYLDNQAHAVVSRMRDLDSGTRTQLRRLYGAVRRAVRTPESERQHEFVMLRARLAYTIARHSLRSLDSLEKLLLQVTRKNEIKGYERFRDLFEAIIAYNE